MPRDDALLDELESDGWTIRMTGSGHYRASRDGWMPVIFAATPSDTRASANQLALVRRLYREHGQVLPRDREPATREAQPQAETKRRVPANLPEDYAQACEQRDELAEANAALFGEIESLRREIEDFKFHEATVTQQVELPYDDAIIQGLISPYLPLLKWVQDTAREQGAQNELIDQALRDIRVLDRAYKNLRGRVEKIEETPEVFAAAAEVPTPPSERGLLEGTVAVTPKPEEVLTPTEPPKKAGHGQAKWSEDRRLNVMLTYDRESGPPRPGMWWRPSKSGKKGQWVRPTETYCWECGKQLNHPSYFCSASHGKKFTSRHPDRIPVTAYRTKRDMTWEQALKQGEKKK